MLPLDVCTIKTPFTSLVVSPPLPATQPAACPHRQIYLNLGSLLKVAFHKVFELECKDGGKVQRSIINEHGVQQLSLIVLV